MSPFSERLTEAVGRYGPLCVGIDPRWEMLPTEISSRFHVSERGIAYLEFAREVLELVRPFTGIIKPQAAFFEEAGLAGFSALQSLMQLARDMGYLAILDSKRGDIASTAEAYARACFEDPWRADAATINPYLGEDALVPFLQVAKQHHGGLFVLVRTSNPGSGLFQNLSVAGKPLYLHVAEAVNHWNERSRHDRALGDVGIVAGATQADELQLLRHALPHCWFLVPGYGAQGGELLALRSAFLSDGLGAVVNSSRGITFPFQPADPAWRQKIVEAAAKSSQELLALSRS